MNEWNFQARAHACQGCGRPFVDRQAYHTLLSEERHGYGRVDVCGECWAAQHGHGATDRKGFVSHWQGVYAGTPPAPPEPIRRDTAETLLRRLAEQADPRHAAACFILAVMLERKRVLKVKDQIRRDGGRVLIYEAPKTGDVFTIPDPELRLDQLEQVQRDVAQLLEHGPDGPAASGAVAVAVAAPAGEAPAPEAAPAGS